MNTDICSPSIGPYCGIVVEAFRTFPNGRKFRLLMYRAFSALGLIGSECNGICVLDEDKMAVLADEMEQTDSGYSVPTKAQMDLFKRMAESMSWEEFRDLINGSRRHRYTL